MPVPDQVIVIVGAGASHACASSRLPREDVHRGLQPPLTSQLFEPRAEFTRILQQYPAAQAAAADIGPALAANAVALEDFLRERLRDSPHAHRRRQYRGVILYLQHLLFDVSQWDRGSRTGYTAHPDNYDRLVSALLELESVVFITLNYDTLLDQRLFAYNPLLSIESYITGGSNWSLIKLHGSVNWGRLVSAPAWQAASPDRFMARTLAALGDEIETADEIVLRSHGDLVAVRQEGHSTSEGGGRLYYPALAAPLGPGDELVCPPSHIDFLREQLTAYDGLNVLVLGYSGLDSEVRRLLRESGNSIRWLGVVSNEEAAAVGAGRAVIAAVREGGGKAPDGFSTFGSGFNDFVQNDSLHQWIDTIP